MHFSRRHGFAVLGLLLQATGACAQFADLTKRDQVALDLIKHSIQQDAPASVRNESLVTNARDRNLRSVKWLVEQGADCNYQDGSGSTAIMLFVQARVDGTNSDPQDPDDLEMHGIREVPWPDATLFADHDKQLLEALISCTKQLNTMNRQGLSVAHLAALKGRFDFLRPIVEAGADVNLPLPGGETIAMLSPSTQFAWLAKAGADLRRTDLAGRNVLHHIARELQGNRLIIALRRAVALQVRDTKDADGHYAADLINGFRSDWMALRIANSALVDRQVSEAQRILRSSRE